MKKTRRAAAVWMTMSLALSTIFGNTAWGEVRQEAGENRCMHVHTAECYGETDETATPSQIGEPEPTECRHVCSVESGCILDTEDKKTEDISNEDQEPSDGKVKVSDDEILDDQEAPSVNTPSNAKDNTSTINGTTIPSSKAKIHSWTWYDPEGILIDGKLELTGVTEEAQPSFAEVTEYLPQAIIAQVGDSEAWEEENLQIVNWTCAEYVQDENGIWPLEGNYKFTAELPEGYELAAGVDALVVEVSVAGDQTAVTDGEYTVMNLSFYANEDPRDLKFNGSIFSSSGNIIDNLAKQNGMSYEHLGQDNFKLILNNTKIYNIKITSGNWIIELHGNNELIGSGKSTGGIGLHIIGGSATITAADDSASLTVHGYPKSKTNDGSCGIEVESTLAIESGIINADVYRYEKHNEASGAIYVTRNGTLNIKGGSVTATGNSRWALCSSGTINMSKGEFNIVGNDQVAVNLESGSNFTLSGGKVNIDAGKHRGLSTKGNLTMTGGEMDVNILEISDGNTMTIEGGTLTTGGIKIGDNGKLVNKGTLIANGSFEGNGVIENTGTISGTGSVPDSAKQSPEEIKNYAENISTDYSKDTLIDVQRLAEINKPDKAGELQYKLLEDTKSESQGVGTINETTGELTVKKAGIFLIKVNTKETGIYKAGTPVTITLTVNQADFPNNWELKVEAINAQYNGSTGYPAAKVTASGIPSDVDVTYEYQVAQTADIASLPENEWRETCPTIVKNSESGQYVFVRVVTDNYKPKVFVSSNTTEIKPRNFSTDVTVTIEPNTLIYNGKAQMPEIKVVESWNGSSGSELKENVDYKIKFWKNEDTGDEVSELKNAGTYTVYLLGNGNYDDSTNSATFTIQKSTLFLLINGSVNKVYDGTVGVTDAQKLAIQLATTKEGTNSFDKIYVDHVEWEYNYADAGKRILTAHDVKIAGPNVENYQLKSTSVSYYATIEKRDFKPMTVVAAPLTYNGTEQKPQINVSLDTGLDKVSSSNAKFYYSMAGENFDSEVPGFKAPGTYTVHVKAEMDNFNPITDKVEVIVQKAAAPTVTVLSENYSYKETGEKRVKFTGIPNDCGTIEAVTAQIVSDESKILDGSPAIDGSELVYKLKGSSKEMIGKTVQIVVTVETQNYEDIKIPVTVTLKADPSDNNSGNNSGNGNSGNNNSGSNSSNGSNGGGSSNSSSDSGSDSSDSDYTDSKTSAPKLSDVRSGNVTSNAANNAADNVTKDDQKGYQSNSQGVITGANNQTANDGYSHWMQDSKGWWLRYSDGSYPKGNEGEQHWEKVNGNWWAFGNNGYLSTGWVYDTAYRGWFYMDANKGMLTGWQYIDGKWYYLNPVSDGNCGVMYAKQKTPDGWFVKEDGSWDEEAGK